MILYANGCSMVEGCELGGLTNNPKTVDREYRNKHNSIGVLGEMLGADEVINQGFGGASNKRIVRTTIDWVMSNKHRDDIFVVIGWTEPSRKEILIQEISNLHNWVPEPEYPYAQISLNKSRLVDYTERTKIVPELTKLTEMYYKNYTCDIDDVYEYLQQIVILSSFLKANNIPYTFFNGLAPISLYYDNVMEDIDTDVNHTDSFKDTLWNGSYGYKDKMQNLYNDITSDKRFFSRFSMYEVSRDKSVEIKPQGHPDEAGHAYWAGVIYRFIKENNLI